MPRSTSTPRPRSEAAARAGLSAAGVLVCAGSWLALGGCSEPVGVGAPPAHSTASAAPGSLSASSPPEAAAPSSTSAPTRAPEPAWRAAVRLERWSLARDALEALDPAEREQPALRFLRARVANELGEHARVQPLLESLELPSFAEDIERLRAEAALEVGPHAVAASWFEKRGRPRDLVQAARAHARAGEAVKAAALAERALLESQRLRRRADERAARSVKVELAESKSEPARALADLRWLAVEEPASSEGQKARKRIAELKEKLSDKERRRIVERLLEANAGTDALSVIDEAPGAFSAAERAHLRADALFKARRYKESADAFVAAAKLASGRTDEQLYYAARSYARIKKEDEAIRRYREVERRYKKSLWAERSAFQAALLLSNQGKYDEASDAFSRYLAAFPKGAQRDDAEYLLALSWLSANKPDKARGVLAKLASRAKKFDWGVYRELEGVAALRAQSRDEAVRIFREVATTQPLTFAALAARARLGELGEPLPPLIDAPPDRRSLPLDPVFPPKAAELVALGLDADAERWLSDNESVASALYPGRETEGLCTLYGQLSRAKRRYKVGSAAVGFQELMRAPSSAERWSWECVYPQPYAGLVGALESERSIPLGLVHSLMRQESAFDPEVRSPVGAEGLMQLMPKTAAEAAKESRLEGFDPKEVRAPEVNIRLGSFYIGKLLRTFDGSLPLAIAGYNAGPTAVSRWVETAKEHEVDVWVARIPYQETRNYVVRVVGNLARYQWLSGGDAAVLSLPLRLPQGARAGEDDY